MQLNKQGVGKFWEETREGNCHQNIVYEKILSIKKKKKEMGLGIVRKLPHNSYYFGKAQSFLSAKGYVASLDRQESKHTHWGLLGFFSHKGVLCLVLPHILIPLANLRLSKQSTALSTPLQF